MMVGVLSLLVYGYAIAVSPRDVAEFMASSTSRMARRLRSVADLESNLATQDFAR
jgi:hypothetical protein